MALHASARALQPGLREAMGLLLEDSMPTRAHSALRQILRSADEKARSPCCFTMSDAQSVADAAGAAATEFRAEGKLSESTALRHVSMKILSHMLQSGQPLRYVPECQLIEQLAVRELELAAATDIEAPLRAAALAARGVSLANAGGGTWRWRCDRKGPVSRPGSAKADGLAAKRFQAIGRLADFCARSAMATRGNGNASEGYQTVSPSKRFDRVTRMAESEVSATRFIHDFSAPRLPVILTGAEQPAVGFRKLKSLCRLRPVRVQRHDPSANHLWANMSPRAREITLAELLARWATGRRDLVIFDEPIRLVCPSMLKMWRAPACVEEADLLTNFPLCGESSSNPFAGHPSLFVQASGSQCGVHVDSFSSQFVQTLLHGKKRWIFWPVLENEQRWLLGRTDAVRLEVQRQRRAYRRIHFEQNFPARLDVGRDSCSASDSELSDSRALRVEVVLNAGETIVVPGGLPHQVVNLEDCIAISQNFVDVSHAKQAAAELRWPVPYDDLATFLENAVSVNNSKRR